MFAPSPHPDLARCQWLSLVVGVVGVAACAVGWVIEAGHFHEAWLVSWLFWLGLSLGMLALLLIQSLIRSHWGTAGRRIFVSGAEAIPLMAVLFLPVIFEPDRVYEWARPEVVEQDHLLQHKQPYLNETWFRIRAGVYLAVWVGVLLLVRRRPVDDHEHPAAARPQTIPLRGPALALLMLTTSFAAFDWAMSLEPHWYSSIYGAIYAVEGLLGAMAAAVLVFIALRRRAGFADFATPQLLNDFGNLLLAFTIIWGYLEFSQYLIIWSGNLPDEIVWYLRRFEGGWSWLIVASVILQLAVPFWLLLFRDVKQDPTRLAAVAGLILVMRYVENYWTVKPGFHLPQLTVHWLDAAAPVGIGGLWLSMLLFRLRSHISDIAPTAGHRREEMSPRRHREHGD